MPTRTVFLVRGLVGASAEPAATATAAGAAGTRTETVIVDVVEVALERSIDDLDAGPVESWLPLAAGAASV